jgi:hypothetical protein
MHLSIFKNINSKLWHKERITETKQNQLYSLILLYGMRMNK